MALEAKYEERGLQPKHVLLLKTSPNVFTAKLLHVDQHKISLNETLVDDYERRSFAHAHFHSLVGQKLILSRCELVARFS